jgi:hypothetical protein
VDLLLNTATHYLLMGSGLGDPCGQGAAMVHGAVGGGMQTAAGILLMAPDPTMLTKVAAGVLEVGSLIQNFFGHPDCSKIAATNVVNQAEQLLKQNVAAWNALPASQKNPATQAAALQNFDTVWQQVMRACGQIGGSAGTACVGDRQQGACHYQNNGCWNWFVGYRDPIANDPAVSANPIGGVFDASAGISPLWIGIALISAAFLLLIARTSV